MRVTLSVLTLLTSLTSLAQASLVGLTSFTAGSSFPSYDNTSMTIGWTFSVNSDIRVSDLGLWDLSPGTPLSSTHQVGLWTNAGSLLASTTVLTTSPLTGGFRYESIAPVLLTAGNTYRLGSAIPVGNSDEYVSGAVAVTTDAAISFLGANRNDSAGGFSAPLVQTSANGRFGPNMLFDLAPIPEPTTALFGAALLGVMGLARRRTRGATVA